MISYSSITNNIRATNPHKTRTDRTDPVANITISDKTIKNPPTNIPYTSVVNVVCVGSGFTTVSSLLALPADAVVLDVETEFGVVPPVEPVGELVFDEDILSYSLIR
jgi:hypothetical protein